MIDNTNNYIAAGHLPLLSIHVCTQIHTPIVSRKLVNRKSPHIPIVNQ